MLALLLIIGDGSTPHLMIGMLIVPPPPIMLPITPVGIMLVVLPAQTCRRIALKPDLFHERAESRVGHLQSVDLIEFLPERVRASCRIGLHHADDCVGPGGELPRRSQSAYVAGNPTIRLPFGMEAEPMGSGALLIATREDFSISTSRPSNPDTD